MVSGPTHGFNNVFDVNRHVCHLVFDEEIASLWCPIGGSTGYCENLSVVSMGNACCNHGAAFHAAFYDKKRIAQSGHNAIAFREIIRVHFGIGRKVCDQSTTLMLHLFCNLSVLCWVDVVESVGHYRKIGYAGVQCSLMGYNINTKGQAAHHCDVVVQ